MNPEQQYCVQYLHGGTSNLSAPESKEISSVCHASGSTKSSVTNLFHTLVNVMANLQQAGICVSHQEFVLTFSPSKGAYKSPQHVQFTCLVCLVLESGLVFPVRNLLHILFSISACLHNGDSGHP